MTIQDLGSIGEFVGAVATVGTLLYLAAQIRANTRAVQAEAGRLARLTEVARERNLVPDSEAPA